MGVGLLGYGVVIGYTVSHGQMLGDCQKMHGEQCLQLG